MTDAVATTTVDAAMEPAFLEAAPATVSSGSSSWCAAVATTATAMAVDAATMTTAGSSWFCFFFAATTALAAVTAAEDVDADPALSTNYSLQTKSRGSFPLPLSVSFCPSLFFLLHIFLSMLKTFQVQFIKSISVQYKFFFFIFHGCCLSDLSYYLSYVKSSAPVII